MGSPAGAAIVEVKPIGTTAAGPGAVAVDAQNRIHVTWQSAVDHQLHHTVVAGKRKTDELVDAQPESGAGSSLAIDSAGHPHVAYLVLRNQQQRLAYAEFDGTAWHTEELGSGGAPLALALDADDQPHIVQQADSFEYVHRDESGWEHEVLSDMDALNGDALSLAIDADGHAHLTANSSGPLGPLYATNASGDWVRTTLAPDGGSEQTVALGALALDSQGQPHVALSAANPTTVRHRHFDGAAWQSEDLYDANSLPPGTTDSPQAASIAIGTSDRPAIVFLDQFSQSSKRTASFLAYAYKRGAHWLELDVAAKADFEQWTRMAAAPDGSAAVLYATKRTLENTTQSLRVARVGIPDLAGSWTSLTVTPKGQISRVTGVLEVANLGPAKSGSPAITLYLSSDAALDGSDSVIGFRKPIGTVGVGHTRSVKIVLNPLVPVSGKYLIAVIDADDQLHDQDPANNVVPGLLN